MGLLEDALRDTFAARVAAPPAVEDAAGQAIQAARRVRRRRTVYGSAAAFVAVVLAGVGVGVVSTLAGSRTGTGPGGPATSVTEVSSFPVDVLIGNRITPGGGGAGADLTALPPAQQAWRVEDGWLVETREGNRSAVWAIAPGLTSVKLAEGDRVAVGRGTRPDPAIAWSSEGQITVASYRNRKLVDPRTAAAPGLHPIALVGTGVVIGGTPPGALSAIHDVWFPGQSDTPAGYRSAATIVGVSGDGSAVFGLSGGTYPCLLKLSPIGFTQHNAQCDLELTAQHRVFGSPDGSWLVVIGSDRVELYELPDMWDAPVPTASWPILATNVVWLADGSFVLGGRSRTVRLFTDDLARAESTAAVTTDRETVWAIPDLRF